MSLTQRQADCLTAIIDLTGEDGASPTFEQIRVRINVCNKSQVHRLVVALENRGYISRPNYRRRALTVLRRPGKPESERAPYLPAALSRLTPEQMVNLMAHLTGLYAHKTSDNECEALLNRLAVRIAHKPRVAA